MSVAAVCGSKRSYQENLVSPPAVTKRLRRCPSVFDRLRAAFPHMDLQVLGRALQESGNDLNLVIKNLHQLSLEPDTKNSDSAGKSGAEWVDLFVSELMRATSIDDAKSRASTLLVDLEKFISTRAGEEAKKSLYEDNMKMKEQLIEGLMKENCVLKRAVAIQHQRQKELEVRFREVQDLSQLVSQYKEELRKLEVKNYALSMHLKQSHQSRSIPDCFHPNVF